MPAGAHQALGLGEHVVALPARPRGRDDIDDLGGLVGNPLQGNRSTARCGTDRTWPSIAVSSRCPPKTSMASARQVWRCSASERGSCLASRDSKRGLLGQRDRLDVGWFAAVGGLELLGQFGGAGFDRRAPRRPPLAAIRLGTPTISRTGRLPRPAGVVSANRSPETLLPRWASRRVLYSSEAATVTRCSGLAVQRQPALHTVGIDGGDLVRDRDVGVQVGVTGA